jgi:hypothetical protein
MSDKRNSKGQFSGGRTRKSSPGTANPSPKRAHITIEHRDGTKVHVPLGGGKSK